MVAEVEVEVVASRLTLLFPSDANDEVASWSAGGSRLGSELFTRASVSCQASNVSSEIPASSNKRSISNGIATAGVVANIDADELANAAPVAVAVAVADSDSGVEAEPEVEADSSEVSVGGVQLEVGTSKEVVDASDSDGLGEVEDLLLLIVAEVDAAVLMLLLATMSSV